MLVLEQKLRETELSLAN